MKILDLKYALILIIFALSSGQSNAQSEYLPGWILTNSNDTIYGLIENDRNMYNSIYCVFKKDNEGLSTQYLPNELKSYYLMNGRYFISKTLQIEGVISTVFLQALVIGELDFYRYMSPKRKMYHFAENSRIGFGELYAPYKKEVYIEKKLYIKTLTPFKRDLINYTTEVPKLEKQILTLSGLQAQELIKIGVDYHTAICGDENCIVYFYEY